MNPSLVGGSKFFYTVRLVHAQSLRIHKIWVSVYQTYPYPGEDWRVYISYISIERSLTLENPVTWLSCVFSPLMDPREILQPIFFFALLKWDWYSFVAFCIPCGSRTSLLKSHKYPGIWKTGTWEISQSVWSHTSCHSQSPLIRLQGDASMLLCNTSLFLHWKWNARGEIHFYLLTLT